MSRSGIQLCVPFEEKRLLKWQPPFIIQPKLDGDRMRALIHEDWVELLSSEGNSRNNALPHIVECLHRKDLVGLELDGEVYQHGMAHEQIHGIASRSVNLHNDFDLLEFWIFDVIMDIPMYQRIDLLIKLNEIFSKVPNCPIHIVPFRVAETLDDVMRAYDEFVGLGYEGIIIRDHKAGYVRKRSTQVMKWKPKKSDYYVVIGYQEEISIDGIPKNSLGALICKANEGEESFNVGTGFSAEQRKDLWQRREELPGKVVHIKYQHITSGRGVPRFPVFAEIIWDLGDSYAIKNSLDI